MIERFIAPALTFIVLIGGHVAIATAMLGSPAQAPADTVVAQAAMPVIQLERVVVTGKRVS